MMEANGVPFAPAVLGLILGPMVEQSFMTTLLKSQGSLTAFVDRPLGMVLGTFTLLAWLLIVAAKLVASRRRLGTAPASP